MCFRGLMGCFVLLFGVAGFGSNVEKEGPPVQLSVDGQARFAVIVGEQAETKTREAAGELARFLGRISGADFQVKTGDGSAGIVVGLPADFSRLPQPAAFKVTPFTREVYVIRTRTVSPWNPATAAVNANARHVGKWVPSVTGICSWPMRWPGRSISWG